ncbi:acylphosphatase [Streptomyces cacaoi]|uniref:acylphosphatase n=1 Tax=Streptomyces cacaoi TaxID=1898 RepID=UPI000A36B477|nr:acylphosphatase [Streptomyces cacaoi]
MISKRVIASGDVQGVYYRDTCRSTAVRHGVRGWCRGSTRPGHRPRRSRAC